MRSGFSERQRVLHRCDAGQMRAIGAGARHQFDMTVQQQRRAAVLNSRRQRLDARDHGALVGFAQPHQHRCDVGAREQAGKAGDKLRRIVHLGRREIEARHRARRNRFGRQIYAAFFSRSGFHSPLLASAFIRARWVKARWPAATFSGLPGPRLLRRRLKRAAVGKCQPPRQAAAPVHGVEMRGRFFVGLSAGKEGNAGHRRGNASLQQPDGFLGDLLNGGLFRLFLPAIAMLGFRIMPSSATR